MTTRYRITIDIEVDRVTRADLNEVALEVAKTIAPSLVAENSVINKSRAELKYVATYILTDDDRDVLEGSE